MDFPSIDFRQSALRGRNYVAERGLETSHPCLMSMCPS